MPVSCRSCGASLIENTRFCRRCGTPLSSAASSDDSVGGSPAAPIVLPSDPGRPTKGLAPEESYRVGSETTRVNRADLDALLRQSSDARPADHDPSSLPTGQRNGYDNQPGSESAALPDFYKTVVSSDNSLARTTPTFTTGELEKNDQVKSPDTFATNVREAHGDDDEELTIVPTMQVAPSAIVVPAMTATVADSSSPSAVVAHQAAGSAPGNVPAARPSPQSNARVIWLAVTVVSVLFLCVLAAGAWLALDYFRRPVAVAGGGEALPIPVADPKQLFDEKMAEAESLLAAGELEKAVASLREANRLDAANTRAHWRLGDLLLETGRRREAIEEYRAVTRNDPSDRAAWRVLASAQLAESAYDEAAESYRRLLGLSDKAAQDANDLLAYADALRLAGRADEARAVYQELSSSTITEAANAARMRLTELTAQLSPAGAVSPQTTQLGSARPNDNDEGEAVAVNAMPAATPTPALSATPTPAPPVSNVALAPAEHFNRAVGLWASNRAAAIAEFRAAANGGSADAYYYLGLGIIEGRDPGTLKRAELVAAMSYFQAARRSRFGAQAQRHEVQLGKEYDRRKKE